MSAPGAPAGLARPLQRWPLYPDGGPSDRLPLGLCAAGIALLPLLRPSLPGNSAPVDLLIALGVAATVLWAGTGGHRIHLPYAIPVALLLIGGAIGSLWQGVPGGSGFALVQDLTLLAWCAALTTVARRPGALDVLVATWAYSAIGWASVLVGAFFSHQAGLAGVTERTGQRAALTFSDPNMAANYFFLAIMIVAAARRPRHRATRLAAYAVLVTAMVLTGSNGGFLCLVIAVAAAIVLRIAIDRGQILALALLTVLALVGVTVAKEFHPGPVIAAAHASQVPLIRDSIGRLGESDESRSLLLDETAALFNSGSLLGRGAESTKPILDHNQAAYVKEAHDDYMATLIERGVIGAVGLLLLVAAVGFRAAWVTATPLPPALSAAIPRPASLTAACIGLALSAALYEVLHFRHVWTLFALLAALHLGGEGAPSTAGDGRTSR
jgi:O-antigen ligase